MPPTRLNSNGPLRPGRTTLSPHLLRPGTLLPGLPLHLPDDLLDRTLGLVLEGGLVLPDTAAGLRLRDALGRRVALGLFGRGALAGGFRGDGLDDAGLGVAGAAAGAGHCCCCCCCRC